MTVTDIQRNIAFNIAELLEFITDLHPIVDNDLQRNHVLSQNLSCKGSFPNFSTKE